MTTTRTDGTINQALLQNFQEMTPNGQGWLRELYFDDINYALSATTYSPYLQQAWTAPDGQFSLAMP
jgi:hypothetical protein